MTASSLAYLEKLKDPRWQKKRLQIFERDRWVCVDCTRSDRTLHVHHLRYDPGKEPWEARDEDLVTLCEICHGKRHKSPDEPPKDIQPTFIFAKPLQTVLQHLTAELSALLTAGEQLPSDFLVKYHNVQAHDEIESIIMNDDKEIAIMQRGIRLQEFANLMGRYGQYRYQEHLDEWDVVTEQAKLEHFTMETLNRETFSAFKDLVLRAFNTFREQLQLSWEQLDAGDAEAGRRMLQQHMQLKQMEKQLMEELNQLWQREI